MTARAFRLAPLLLGVAALASWGVPDSSAHLGSRLAEAVPVAAADTFHATVTGAAGRFSGDAGSAIVLLRRGASSGNGTTTVTLSIRGTGCRSARHCLDLRGQLAGQMTLQHSLADVGHSYVLTAAGTISPLGHVSASGTAAGTGFIRSGHTRLTVTLQPTGGTVTLSGQSPAVPGFTQP